MSTPAVATRPAPLPARVANAPARPTMLYDGRCRICTSGADRVRSYDTAGKIDVLSLHDPSVAQRFPEVKREHVLASMHLVNTDGSIDRGADAVREIMRLIPRVRWIALLWLIPGFSFLADAGYAWVAKNRYRFNKKVTCDGDVCRIHN